MPHRRILLLIGTAMLAIILFMTLGSRGDWSFILPFRGVKLLALVTVGVSIAVSTILFQTVTENRILTPSLMGFDALYILFQSLLVLVLGGAGFATLDNEIRFGLETLLLCAAAITLFSTLLRQARTDLFRMLLVGVVFGILFRSVTALVHRIIDPNAFAVLQNTMFAQFTRIDTSVLGLTFIATIITVTISWRLRHKLDVMALGRDHAINLGLNHKWELFRVLALVAVLVSTSTALVGPVSLLGLLVAALTHSIMQSSRHSLLLVASSLIAITTLIGGQAVFEHVLGLGGTLSVVVEFLGGLVFIYLVLRKRAR